MTRQELEYGEDDKMHFDHGILESIRSREKIQDYMRNKDRKFSQWVPSRDWSRLFVLSTIPAPGWKDRACLYLEFYNFANEKQSILSSPLRINFLSQLLIPQWIQYAGRIDESWASELKIETSFTGDTLAIRLTETDFGIINLNPNWTWREKLQHFKINDANIESIKISCSKLYIKSNEFYYKQSAIQLNEYHKVERLRDKALRNIIQCGIYDILIYDDYVSICSNIDQFDLIQADTKVDAYMLKLLKSSKFIQLDHRDIACLAYPQHDMAIPIMTIRITQDSLVMSKKVKEINIKSPWNLQPSDCLFNLFKYEEERYIVLIVSSASKKELFYQYYRVNWQSYDLAYQKPLNDHINLQQIPHLPIVAINGSQFINCDHRYFVRNQPISYQLELDLRQDEAEILNQDQENINSQNVEVYSQNFKEFLFRFIEEKEKIFDVKTQSDIKVCSIEIPELRTSIIINSGGLNSGILIFQPSLDKIKHLKINQPILYKTHKVIYLDASYKVSIILSKDNALNEIQMSFDHLAGATLTPLKFIMNFTEAQKEHEIYLNDEFTVSLFIPGPAGCFKHFSLNQKGYQEETIKFDFIDGKSQITIPQLTSFIQRIAHNQSIKFGNLLLENIRSIFFKNTEVLIKQEDKVYVFAFQNKFILFEKLMNSLIIMDDSFTVISTIISFSKFPPSIIRIASSMDPEALECIDEINYKIPIPILGNLQDYKSYNKRLNYYTNNFNCPMPVQFGLLDGFISHLDFQFKKLQFFKSNQDKKDGNIAARIEVISQRESFIDDLIFSKEKKYLEERINKMSINELLSYNLNQRMNLIIGTKLHPQRDHIYSILYKLLEIAQIKELPMLIYNTSVDPSKYESILDVLIENKAIKLAQLIVNIAIKQDHIGYIYSRLGPYLQIFSLNDVQSYVESQIFFYKIPEYCYEQYQIVQKTLVRPFSDYQTFSDIQKNMMKVENYILQINEDKAKTERKDSGQPEVGMEGDQLQIRGKILEEKMAPVPTEYYAINLMNLIKSKEQPLIENHRKITKVLNDIVEKDESIFEKEAIQLIIDFKWDSYAMKFFSVQLGLFICFIISFIIDVVAVSRNSHIFQSDDSNQAIPRIISAVIMILFGMYEIAQIVVTRKTYFKSFWNVNDLALIFVYGTYFAILFAKPEQEDVLKSLQLLIVILSFIKFSFLIRIWTQVSFLVRMLIVVFKELIIFLSFFLLVIGGLTVMAQIIIKESGDEYKGIKLAAYFVIVLRQSIGDYDTSSIIQGTQDFKILAWLLWFIILIIGNIVFMNFIIAVVSESYESCMEKKVQLIYKAKLEMITECEDLMPEQSFTKMNWFPRFIIIRREQGSSAGGENPDEWYGFVKRMKRHLEHETFKLNEKFIENINRSTESTKKDMKTGKEELKKEIAELKTGQEEAKKKTAEVMKIVAYVKTCQEEMKAQINQINIILSAVFQFEA